MVHPGIKINTNVPSTKRGFPEDDDELADIEGEGEVGVGVDPVTTITGPALDTGDRDNLPPFLCQSNSDIHRKFQSLEWLQRLRFQEALTVNDPLHRWALEGDPEIKARNRYPDVQAWANSRVHLRVPNGECDFINASPITLKDSAAKQERRYIATQGPKLGHTTHFWHMVFQESKEVAVVVMLTRTIELGREKCAQYFPLRTEDPPMPLRKEPLDPFVDGHEHGEMDPGLLGTVKLLDYYYDETCGSHVRKLRLSLGSESKIVWHYLYACWPDHSKPQADTRAALLQLIKTSASKCPPGTPRVVHCSAGVGRTGTFIALDHLLQELDSGQLLNVTDPETDPVFETVNQLREQRMMMVYNEMQLQFLYEVLRERADMKLRGVTEEVSDGSPSGGNLHKKSPKIAKLSEPDEVSPNVEHVPGRVPTPTRSWSGTPEVSDNE